MESLSIGIFTPMFIEINGTAKATRNLALALAKEGKGRNIEVHVYAPKADKLAALNIPDNLFLHPLKSIRIHHDPEVNFTIPFFKYFTPGRFSHLDVTHSMAVLAVSMLGMDVAKFNRIPKVATHHSPLAFYAEQYVPFIGKGLKYFTPPIERYLYNRYDLLTVPTPSKKNLLIKWGYDEPIISITNGITDEYFIKTDPESLRRRYGLEDKLLLVYASRMSREKNIRPIIRTFRKILEKVPSAHLVLVGSGPEVEPAARLIRELGLKEHVTQTGLVSQKELITWYAAADVTCIWSYVEAQGLVILEAMAQGTPTVGTNADGIKDTIIHGKTGFLADNLEDFVDKVVYLFENPDVRKVFGKNARKYVEYHRIGNIARIWFKIYRKLIEWYPIRPDPEFQKVYRAMWRKFAAAHPAVNY